LEFPALGRTLALAAGQGVLVWPHTEFRGRVAGGRVRASIQHFRVGRGDGEPFTGLAAQRGGFAASAAGGNAAWLTRCMERLQRSTARVRPWLLAVVLVEGGFLLPTAKIPSAGSRLDLATLADWIRAHLPENPGVPELAAQAGLSPSRFRAVFLTQRGLSAGKFVLTLRTEEARRLLAETREPLKVIAAKLGHADAVVFSRAFKRATGLTPAHYRRQHRIRG
jgi:AraC-like DNA-binding protein